ncbi:MAG: hypothetical protein QM490_05980, partial [Candidatus Gracilibacteria bacterium]
DPTFVDYSNFVYTTGNIATTLLDGIKTGNQYHINRSSSSFFGYHDPEGTSNSTSSEWFNTLTYDLADGNTVADYSWAFSPSNGGTAARGYGLGGAGLSLSTQAYPWTIWVR